MNPLLPTLIATRDALRRLVFSKPKADCKCSVCQGARALAAADLAIAEAEREMTKEPK